MILKLIGLCVAFGLVYAKPGSPCTYGDWGKWGECKSSSGCSGRGESWDAEPSQWDSGRKNMLQMMHIKQEAYNKRERCLADGSCPEFAKQNPAGKFDCVNGFSDVNECRFIHRAAFLGFRELAGDAINITGMRGNDIWGWTDPIDAEEYAVVGLSAGTSFVRVTDPENPVVVGYMPTQTVSSIWRDIKVIGNFAYIGSEAADHGMQIFDLTQLRGRKTLKYFSPTRHYDRIGQSHNIVHNEDTDFIYIVGSRRGNGYDLCGGGLHVVDVSDPINPRYSGCFGDDGYTHDAQCVIYSGPDARFVGREICFAFNEDSFTIVDVDDKNDMKVIARKVYTGVEYSHQGWVTEDHTLVLLDDELDELRNKTESGVNTRTYIWDVTDMTNPELKVIHYSAEKSIDHNQYIRDNLSYQSNYEAGLRIMAIDQDNFALTEVAYFDIHHQETEIAFDGAWSVYNYFQSGTVVVDGISTGLWILRPDYDAINAAVRENTEYREERRVRTLLHGDSTSCPLEGETRHCQATTNTC